ncbi:2Fe-2S iron-sulfur cluster-binding protein [Streptomyces canus]|uniref:2Fe-2S iron-sulfur cluster-binding protein n=1 Tax=Streptomyces canus TaxID=58343 RepID=UPI0033EA8127
MARWIRSAADSGALLELADTHGVLLPASCRASVCGTCAATMHGPAAYLADPLAEPADGQALLCCSVAPGQPRDRAELTVEATDLPLVGQSPGPRSRGAPRWRGRTGPAVPVFLSPARCS